MTYTRLICLANSSKRKERCVAGIDPISGQWIRPISPQYPDGKVPGSTPITINNRDRTLAELNLLDIVDIPLDTIGPDFGFTCENRTILPGSWKLIGKATIEDIIPFINFCPPILHNAARRVPILSLQALPINARKSLDIIYTKDLEIEQIIDNNRKKYKATFSLPDGHVLEDISVTDNLLLNALDRGDFPKNPCLLTLSLSMPFPEPLGDCYKLLAGFLNLTLDDQILIEMRIAGWDVPQARQYIWQTYQKQSRREMTDSQKLDFISYLEKLP